MFKIWSAPSPYRLLVLGRATLVNLVDSYVQLASNARVSLARTRIERFTGRSVVPQTANGPAPPDKCGGVLLS